MASGEGVGLRPIADVEGGGASGVRRRAVGWPVERRFPHEVTTANVRDAQRRKRGGVAERLKAPVLKTGSGESRSWVRIPPPPFLSPRRREEFDELHEIAASAALRDFKGHRRRPRLEKFWRLFVRFSPFRNSAVDFGILGSRLVLGPESRIAIFV
jgi:hypothetical protein